jgi:penicillin-binding protein 2
LFEALKNSCNIYFYNLGKKLDIDTIAKYAGMLGLGERNQIDLPNEKAGLVPTRAWKKDNFDQPWFPGETISVSIGGGMITVTPIQVLGLISTVALRGEKPQFHLLDRIEKDGEVVRKFQYNAQEIPIEKSHFELVIRGLFDVVNDGGTGRAARIAGMEICGKTGTQQIISKENPNYAKLVKQKRFKPHSWFASFAPRSNPKYAVVVFIENGGDAGRIAAPVAGKIYKKLFNQ